MSQLINGKEIAAALENSLTQRVRALINGGTVPCLAVIKVGDNAASAVYVRNKEKACERVGIKSLVVTFPEAVSQAELIRKIQDLNNDSHIDGILVQLPLPSHIDKNTVINSISPQKDVDCFVPHNVGLIGSKNSTFLPCTPAGIIDLIKSTGTDICGKNCVVIGRSDIVGLPCARLLTANNGTVTLCHSKTSDLKSHTRNADILVVAVGKEGFITGDYIKPGAVVIDVGINRNAEGKLKGDVDFDSCSAASFITPVPGGVGPMTIAKLLENTLRAAETYRKKQ